MPRKSRIDYLTSAETCALLDDLDRSTLVRWVQAGKLKPAKKLPGLRGAYLFDRRDVEAIRAARAKTPDDEPNGTQVA